MPNYCDIILTLRSDSKIDLERFYKENYLDENQPLSFHKQVPVIDDINCDNVWGTKCDPLYVEVEDNIHTEQPNIIYFFQTPWSPPMLWLEEILNRTPNMTIEIEYSEQGCDFWGKKVYTNNSCIFSEEKSLGEYNWNRIDKTIIDNILCKFVPLSDDNDTLNEIIEELSLHTNYSDNIQFYLKEYINLGYNPLFK